MIRGDRIKELLSSLGLTQASLARAIKVSPQAVSKMVSGGTVETGKLHQIARFLGTTPEYLTGESDKPRAENARAENGGGGQMMNRPDPNKQSKAELAHEIGLIELEEIDLGLGMGAAYLDDAPVSTSPGGCPRNGCASSPLRQPHT